MILFARSLDQRVVIYFVLQYQPKEVFGEAYVDAESNDRPELQFQSKY